MGETTAEFIHIVVNTIIFCSAIGLLIVCLNVLAKYNRGEIESQRTKPSITMGENGYSEDRVFVRGSQVFTDIIYQQDIHLPIFLDGTQLTADYLRYLRESNNIYVNDLRARISMNNEYLITHDYNSNNEITAVHYERR